MSEFYENQIMTEAGNRNRKYFQFVNEVVNINGDEKTVEKNAVDDLDKFNNFFATIRANLAKKFSSPKLTQRAKQINSMFFRTIDEKEVTAAIAKIKKRYSTDCYNLNYVYIKAVSASVSPVLTMLFNKCFEEGNFPKPFKIAAITPLHKEGDKSKPENYKPISLLPIIGKIFEFLIFDRIKNYIEKFKILKANQFGFRSNHNTADAIVSLLEDIRMNKQNNANEIKVIFLDLKKAFDTVDHHILLEKCSDFGLRVKTLSIIASFLHDRTQVVKLKAKSSKSRQVSFGVPQGSIPGPLLFIL